LFLIIKTKKYPNFIPIGYMEIQQLGESEVRLENIGIIPSFRNNGYATHFIKTILKQYAIDAKIKYCLLNVWCENKSAIAVYTKIGFKLLCVRSDHWGKNIHAYYY
jgi:ribosomal protein S18 acetylase RimI-like enzyme